MSQDHHLEQLVLIGSFHKPVDILYFEQKSTYYMGYIAIRIYGSSLHPIAFSN